MVRHIVHRRLETNKTTCIMVMLVYSHHMISRQEYTHTHTGNLLVFIYQFHFQGVCHPVVVVDAACPRCYAMEPNLRPYGWESKPVNHRTMPSPIHTPIQIPPLFHNIHCNNAPTQALPIPHTVTTRTVDTIKSQILTSSSHSIILLSFCSCFKISWYTCWAIFWSSWDLQINRQTKRLASC